MQLLVFFACGKYEAFRLADLSSAAQAESISLRILNQETYDPFRDRSVAVEVDSYQSAEALCGRCILVDSIQHVIVETETRQDAVEQLGRLCASGDLLPFLQSRANAPPSSFCIVMKSIHRKIRSAGFQELVQQFVEPFAAEKPDGLGLRVRLKDPSVRISLILEHEPSTKELLRVKVAREVAVGSRRPLLKKYDLRSRDYIGTTSMPAEPSFFVANQAHSRPGSLMFDPFVGTGSLAIACSHFGACVIGSDIDIRVLRGERRDGALEETGSRTGKRVAFGKPGMNVFSNFSQYDLTHTGFDAFRGDIAQIAKLLPCDELFDAIVCDPPYGIRESCSRIGRAELRVVPSGLQRSHIPSRVQYPPSQMMTDLVNFAARSLVIGGRFVFWLVEDPNKVYLPSHPAFRLVGNVLERLRPKMHRRLLTFEKIRSFEEAGGWCEESGSAFAGVRESLFGEKTN